jgi:two-component sensor histidine kinase
MQSIEMKSDESKTYFTEAINRIMAMFLVHQKLYGEKELSKIDLEKYIEELVNDIITISLDKNNVELLIKVNVEYLSLDTIMPLGLLINELASNSLKHAFNDKKGQISIVINQTGDKFDFDYSDNGIWKTPVSDRVSFGVELIDILTDQMNGSKVLHTEKGTHYSFKLTNL